MAENPDNEYMEMDADQWEGNNDDIYENGDTLGVVIGEREGQKNGTTNRRRYITIRRPALSQNNRVWKRKLLDTFRFATVGLAVLCILLIASLIALCFAYNALSSLNTSASNRMDKLIQKNIMLEAWLNELTQNQSWSMYHISSTAYPDCLSGDDVYVAYHQAFQKYIQSDSFYLYYGGNGTCSNHFAWNCTC